MLVLEELEHAKARDAIIHGEIIGQCSTANAFRLTDSHDQGRGAVAAMQRPLLTPVSPGRRRLHQRSWHEHQEQRLGRNPRH